MSAAEASGAGAGAATPTPWDAIVLLAHGSRDASWSRAIETLATRVRARTSAIRVSCAYLEFTQPDLPGAVRTLVADGGAQRIKVLPLFLGLGHHVRADLPVLLDKVRREHPQILLEMQQPVGEDERLLDLLAEIALD